MTEQILAVRNAVPNEYKKIGELMVKVYSKLDGFPTIEELPSYYEKLVNIGSLTNNSETELLVAVTEENEIAGGVVYLGDMQFYGSDGTATKEANASGIRLLAVDNAFRGQGIGKLLTQTCIQKAKEEKAHQVILHTTKAMMPAWKMYEKIGFSRSEDLDFMQGDLQVFGFRLKL